MDLEASEHRVPLQQGQNLAESWNIPFFATSAKTGENVEQVFYEAARFAC